MKTRRSGNTTEAGAATAANKGPRLVKAAELVAREVVRSIPRMQPKPAPRPVRMPRGAAEARDFFNTLFGEPAKA